MKTEQDTSIKAWEKQIAALPQEQAVKYRDALATLETWKFFDERYHPTGFGAVLTMLKYRVSTPETFAKVAKAEVQA